MADTNNETEIIEEDLSLEEFLLLPTTISMHSIYSERLVNFIKERPYLRLGNVLDNAYAVIYTNQNNMDSVIRELGERFIDLHNIIYTLLGKQSLNAIGVSSVQQIPNLDLRGQGVLLGFVDTGIDYTNPSFIYEDNTTKIQYIWDQTISGELDTDVNFGSVFTKNDINEALESPTPRDIVPHVDDVGHGTFLAALAGGRENKGQVGVAPESDIIAVKLKKASDFYLSSTAVPPGTEDVFESVDIMLGIHFIIKKAAELNRPVAICIALGTNFGSHDGFSLMEEYMTFISNRQGVAICTAAGNEGDAKHHTDGILTSTDDTKDIDIQVSDDVSSVSVYIWTELWNKISVSIVSPSGETVKNIPFQVNLTYEKILTLEQSVVQVNYFRVKSYLVIVHIHDPTPGIWEIIVHGDSVLTGEYHAWLPITGMISPGVIFLEPKPNYTIVNPATALGTITCGAYNSRRNSLYVSSSRGPTRLPRMSPDFVAPGVNVSGVFPNGYGTMSGTSVAAAITIGACALILQWGIVEGNENEMNCERIRAMLIAGCERDRDKEYPNVNWGYGKLNLLNTFNFLRK